MRTRQLKTLVAALFCFMIVDGALQGFIQSKTIIETDIGWQASSFFSGFPRVFYGFVLGILLYRFTNGDAEQKAKMLFSRSIHPLALYAALTLILLFPFKLYGLYNEFFLAIIAPLLVVLGSVSLCRDSFTLYISRFLGWISYPLYCLHVPIKRCVRFIFEIYPVQLITRNSFLVEIMRKH